MNRRQFSFLCGLLIFLPVLSVPISSQTSINYETEEITIGYNITESYLGIIKNLVRDENQTSFTGVFGIMSIFSVRDGGGIAIGIGSLRGLHVSWSNEWTFQGFLGDHFIWGKIKYRIE
jgi:hypothetical protein